MWLVELFQLFLSFDCPIKDDDFLLLVQSAFKLFHIILQNEHNKPFFEEKQIMKMCSPIVYQMLLRAPMLCNPNVTYFDVCGTSINVINIIADQQFCYEHIKELLLMCLYYVQIDPKDEEEFKVNPQKNIEIAYIEHKYTNSYARTTTIAFFEKIIRFFENDIFRFLNIFFDFCKDKISEGFYRLLICVLKFVSTIFNQLTGDTKTFLHETLLFLFSNDSSSILTKYLAFSYGSYFLTDEIRCYLVNIAMDLANLDMFVYTLYCQILKHIFNVKGQTKFLSDENILQLFENHNKCLTDAFTKVYVKIFSEAPQRLQAINFRVLNNALNEWEALLNTPEINQASYSNLNFDQKVWAYCKLFSQQALIDGIVFPFKQLSILIYNSLVNLSLTQAIGDFMTIITSSFKVKVFKEGINFFFELIYKLLLKLDNCYYEDIVTPLFALFQNHLNDLPHLHLINEIIQFLIGLITPQSQKLFTEDYLVIVRLLCRFFQAGFNINMELITNSLNQLKEIDQYIYLMLLIEVNCSKMLRNNEPIVLPLDYLRDWAKLCLSGFMINEYYRRISIFGLSFYINNSQQIGINLQEVINNLILNTFEYNKEFLNGKYVRYIDDDYISPFEILAPEPEGFVHENIDELENV